MTATGALNVKSMLRVSGSLSKAKVCLSSDMRMFIECNRNKNVDHEPLDEQIKAATANHAIINLNVKFYTSHIPIIPYIPIRHPT